MLLLIAPFMQENEAPIGPVYPYWYKPSRYPKPDLTKILMLADNDEQAHKDLLARFEEDYKRIHLKTSSVFSRDKRAKDPFVSTSLNNEVRLIANLGAGLPLIHEIQTADEELEDDAQKVEDYLDSVREDETRGYRDSTMGVLQRDEWMSALTYGRFVWRVTTNLEDEENPIRVNLLDPATVFPTNDGWRGLCRVTRKYQDRICDVIGAHDPDGYGGMRTKILDAAAASAAKTAFGPDGAAKPVPGLDDQRAVEVIEYEDPRWCALVVDRKLVKCVAHNAGHVRYVYQLVGEGAPAFTTMAFNRQDPYDRRSVKSRNGRPIADMGVSHIHYIKHTHNIIESIHTRGLMEIMKSANPPVIRFQTREAANTGLKTADTSEGAVNPAVLGEEQFQVWPTAPAPHVFGPVLTQVGRDMATGTMPLAAFGVNEKSNVSGHALENLEDQGREKMAPVTLAWEMGRGAVAEMILRQTADWGDWAGYEGNKGKIPVYRPNPAPGEIGFFEIDPPTIRRVGIRVKCSGRSIRMESMGPLFNAATQGMQLGVLTGEDVLRMRGVKDVRRYQRRWEDEKLRREALDHPKAKEYLIGRLFDKSTDPEDMAFARWWQENVTAAPPPQSPQGPPGMGGGPPQPPGGLPTNTTAGVSLPALGAPPGPGSGPRPPLSLTPGPIAGSPV